jgi:hypothetical protein
MPSRRLLVASLALTACIDPAEGERLGSIDEPIVNGAFDVTHQAVVAWLHGSKCSATIVAVVGNQGYALTAAHCVGGGLGNIYQGNDHDDPDVIYDVVDAEVHPGYAQSGAFDFAMLRFTGASVSTPVIAPLTKAMDNINNGTIVDLVGYGQTENGGTSIRRHVNLPVDSESPMYLQYDQTSAGLCFGDSGGSSLVVQAGTPYAAGVHSSVSDNNCVGPGEEGYDVRVSAVVDTFIDPYIDNQPFGLQTCDECTDAHAKNGQCTDDIIACFQDGNCEAYVQCLNGCATLSCQTQCAISHPAGKQVYDLITDCFCSTCATECQNDPLCIPPPPCGFTANDPECNTCFAANCCPQGQACGQDAVCLDCFTNISPPPACDTDPEAVALSSCLEQSCAVECNLGAGGAGAGGAGVGGAGVGGGGPAVGVGGSVGAGGDESLDAKEPQVVEQGCGCRTAGGRDRRGVALLAAAFLLAWRRGHQGRRCGGRRQDP